MVLAAVLEEKAFAKTSGSTKVTAIAMPKSLLTRRYRRQVKLVHVEKDELCVWHPRAEDIDILGQNGIQVTYIEGAIQWLGGKKHNYGHFTVADLPVPMTSTVCSTTTACCLRMSATRLHCASCRGAPFECLTPSGICWPGLAMPVHSLTQRTVTWCYWHHVMEPWLKRWVISRHGSLGSYIAGLDNNICKTISVKTHLEECTTRYLGFKCFLFPCTEFIQK